MTGSESPIDAQHLRLLELFHYIWGGICCLWGLVGLAYIWIGETMLKNFARTGEPLIFGQLFVAFSVLGFVMFESCGLLSLITAKEYRLHRGYWMCFAVSICNCILMPVGTALGVFALFVLSRPSVKAAFAV